MRSYFGKVFYPILLVLLVSLLIIGISLHMLVRGVLKDRSMKELETTAESISELAEAYLHNGYYLNEDFVINLTFATRSSGSDAVICDLEGRLILCSDAPFSCNHRGMLITRGYLRQVLRQDILRSTGKIEGLYTDSRYVVATPLRDRAGAAMGIVIVSHSVSDTRTVLGKMTNIYLSVSILVVLVAVAVMSTLLRRQNAPLRDMAKAARDFGHGDLNARVAVEESSSLEIQDLALAFNNMASSLQKSEYQRQEFVANVSHELKTPMTTISGFVDGILDGTIPAERQQHYMHLVSDETKRLNRLVRSMLDISKLHDQGGIPEERKTRFDVTETAGQVLITFEQKIVAKQLEVQVEMPDHPVFTRADQDAITQVIYNLVDNAVKFCPQGGHLGVQIQTAGPKIYFRISNSGQTIPPQELPLVFDRFHKLDKSRSRSKDGWGLGLYIVRALVSSHGENISVTSANDRTEFTFTLPLVN